MRSAAPRRVSASPSRGRTRSRAIPERNDGLSATLLSRLLAEPQHLDSPSVLALQRRAGNAAVQRLLRVVQRDPLSQSDDPEGYTSKSGKANVKGSGTTRREVHDLKYGVSGGFKSEYWSNFNKKNLNSEETAKTLESPDNMAVVIMPDKLDKVDTRPVQVILHFAGWGFRGGDPYAGYTLAKGDSNVKKGTIRDADQEHWEQQIGALNQERAIGNGPQTIAILAQGRGMSDFGKVPTFDYVQDVLSKVPELSGVGQYTLVLSGHSGGGATQVAKKVNQGVAKTADRTKLAAAEKGEAAPQPTDMVMMFDAEGIEDVGDWAVSQIGTLASTLKDAKPAEAQAAIAGTPKLRAYFWNKGAYATRYKAVYTKICTALAAVPKDWAVPDSPTSKTVTVSDLFRVIEVSGADIDHEHVISGGAGAGDKAKEGNVAEALRASADPTIDRDKGLPCIVEAPKAKSKSKSKSSK